MGDHFGIFQANSPRVSAIEINFGTVLSRKSTYLSPLARKETRHTREGYEKRLRAVNLVIVSARTRALRESALRLMPRSLGVATHRMSRTVYVPIRVRIARIADVTRPIRDARGELSLDNACPIQARGVD